MCKTLTVSASGFYGWLGRPVCQRRQANITLTAQIREAFVASDETYSMPRIRAELMDAGIVASRKRIAALMRQEHMRGVSRGRSFCITSERDARNRPAPDLVNREFVATDINPLWVADHQHCLWQPVQGNGRTAFHGNRGRCLRQRHGREFLCQPGM